jgi:hypothetical protein
MELSFYKGYAKRWSRQRYIGIYMFLRREIFYIDGALFNKTGTLAEFSQLYNYERFGV